MRKIYVIAIVALMLTACNKSDNLVDFLPADLRIAAKLNALQLIKKSGCSFDPSTNAISLSPDVISSFNLAENINTLLANGWIDFNEAPYFVVSQEGIPMLFVRANESQLEEIAAAQEDIADGVKHFYLTERFHAYERGGVAIIVDDIKFDNDYVVDILLKRKQSKPNERVLKSLEGESDICGYVSPEVYKSAIENHPLAMSAMSEVKGLKIAIDFVEAEMSAKISPITNSDLKSLIAPFVTKKGNTSPLKYIASSCDVVASFPIDLSRLADSEEFAKILKQYCDEYNLSQENTLKAITSVGGMAIGIDLTTLYVTGAVETPNASYLQKSMKVFTPLFGATTENKSLGVMDIKAPGFNMTTQVVDGMLAFSTAPTIFNQEQQSIYTNEKVRSLVADNYMSLYLDFSSQKSALAEMIRSSFGVNLTGYTMLAINQQLDVEVKLYVQTPDSENILAAIFSALVRAKKSQEPVERDINSDNPMDYVPGKRLD